MGEKSADTANTLTMELPFPDFKYTYAEFFAGCGGLSLGFEQAGLKCISALERDAADKSTTLKQLIINYGLSLIK